MTDLIPIKFQLFGVVTFLASAVAVFHLGFVYRRRTRRFWIKADYAYYFIGVLGLLGITDNFQDLMYNHRLGLKERAFQVSYQAVHQQVDRLDKALRNINYQQWTDQGSYLYTSPAGAQTASALPLEAKPHFQAASSWFSDLATVLADKQRTERWRQLLAQAENTGDSGIAVLDNDRSRTVQDLKKLVSLKSTVNDLRKHVTRDSVSEHELIELFIAPYLIALALALRLSKTSAEFFGRVKGSDEEAS